MNRRPRPQASQIGRIGRIADQQSQPLHILRGTPRPSGPNPKLVSHSAITRPKFGVSTAVSSKKNQSASMNICASGDRRHMAHTGRLGLRRLAQLCWNSHTQADEGRHQDAAFSNLKALSFTESAQHPCRRRSRTPWHAAGRPRRPSPETPLATTGSSFSDDDLLKRQQEQQRIIDAVSPFLSSLPARPLHRAGNVSTVTLLGGMSPPGCGRCSCWLMSTPLFRARRRALKVFPSGPTCMVRLEGNRNNRLCGLVVPFPP
jgi:hypothetical protein